LACAIGGALAIAIGLLLATRLRWDISGCETFPCDPRGTQPYFVVGALISAAGVLAEIGALVMGLSWLWKWARRIRS